MSKFLRYSLLVLTLMSLSLSSVAHANAPSHDSTECSVCIYQPNTDLQANGLDLVISESFDLSEQVPAWATPLIAKQVFRLYYGRAPPLDA